MARDEDAARRDHREMLAVAAGDEAAFRRLTAREAPRLVRFARGLLGSMEEAEDAAQDTLIRLWENAAGWTPDARVSTWLHRVCYNRAIDMLRRRRVVVDDAVLEAMPDAGDLPDSSLLREERADLLHGAIDALPPRQRTAILLFHFQDMPQRDAAAVMEISEAAFESVLARARRQLKAALSDGAGLSGRKSDG